MKLTTEDFTLRGSGQVDFALQANLLANVIFSKRFTLSMTDGKDLSDLLPYENEGLLIPVRITGSLMSPMVLPDLATVLSSLTQGKLKQQIGSLLGGKEGEGGSPLNQILGGTSTGSKDQKTSPLGQILGGTSSGGTKGQQSSPLNQILGGPQTSQTSGSTKSPLDAILGGGTQTQQGQTSSPSKSPLDTFLGGTQTQPTGSQKTTSPKSPLDAIFGGQGDTQGQTGTDGQQKESDKSPFKLF
jgi:hypothetical protein